ncbi:hypothetical protein H4217_001696 [Coemansia sp. RSA 1939]|nr:hypothetical protein H4217_001696 [Coemansia sp. RSA 1939]KAJ2615534.1 hypothetical protein EV177_001531 [Coemansia sp. RSA 1804]
MAKTRLGTRGLMSLIPIVLRYFYEYDGRSNSVDNAVDFYYDRWVCELSVGGFEIVLHYIMAFIELGDYEKACSVVVTIENMPPKPIKGPEGNSRDIAGVLKYILSADIDSTICDVFFDGFGKIEIGNAAGPTIEKPKYAVLRLKLADLIVKFATARVDKDSDAATSVLSAMSHRLQPLTTMAIVRQLNRISTRNAAGWITRNFYKFDMEAQKTAFAWLTTNLLEDKNACSQFISYYSFSDLNTVSRLVHLVLRHPLDEKTDERYILDLALQHIPRNGNAKAIGSLLIAMAKGPVSSHLSSFNLQSLTSCGWMTAGLLSSITQIKDLDISTLIPYMFKAAQLLNSSNLEQILWKEVLRHGIDVGQSILKPSLAMRFGRGNPNETTLELVRHALCLSTEPEEIHETEQLATEDNVSDNHLSSNSLAALYVVILNGANHAGAFDAVELLANFMLDNSDLSDRSFGSLASIWLDSAGFSKQSSNDNVQRVWNIIKSYTGPEIAAKRMREEYHINRNHYHSVIEALIRQGDVEGAWFMICFEMRKALIKPDLKTFYTIISPLASSSQLWSLGKDMVQRFNRQHPEIVKEALNDRSNRPILQALLRMSLKSTSGTNMSTLHPLSKLGTRPL